MDPMEAKKRDVPVFELFAGDGVSGLALVDRPAIELGWMAFAKANFHPNCRCTITKGVVKLAKGACDFCKEAKKAYNAAKRKGGRGRLPREIEWVSPDDLNFAAVDSDRMILAGPLMVPDLRIPRVDADGNRFEVFFSKETVETMAKRFLKEQRNVDLNEGHTDKAAPAYVFESWIVTDPERDKSAALGHKVPAGTWFGMVQVEDRKYWDEAVRTGKLTGFSVEVGVPSKTEMRMQTENFVALLDGTELLLEDGSDSIDVGSAVFVKDGDEMVPAPDGRHKAEGMTIVVADGVVTEMVEDAADEAAVEAVDRMAEDAVEDKVDWKAMHDEVMAALTDLATRVAALETDAAETKDAAAKVAAEVEKFSKIPAARSVTVSTRQKAEAEPTSRWDRLVQARKDSEVAMNFSGEELKTVVYK